MITTFKMFLAVLKTKQKTQKQNRDGTGPLCSKFHFNWMSGDESRRRGCCATYLLDCQFTTCGRNFSFKLDWTKIEQMATI